MRVGHRRRIVRYVEEPEGYPLAGRTVGAARRMVSAPQ